MEQQIDTSNVLIDLNTRIRVLEEKNNLLREKVLIVNQNMVEEYKKLLQEIRTINSDVREIKEDVQNLRDMARHIIKESSNFARKDSVLVLEKYINIWNPMNFTTEQDVIKIMEHQKKR
ncbi:hypothetical protein J4404_01135 [Candidatus Woesearchaeota archaeon]|nr:hypothetical protein [Candidatus Woesearchaeota archaeon]